MVLFYDVSDRDDTDRYDLLRGHLRTRAVENVCHILSVNAIYPYLFAIQNGAALDHGEERVPAFDVQCPDGGRVCIHGELLQK